SARGAALIREGKQLVEVIEMKLDADAATGGTNPDAGAEGRLERVGSALQRGNLIGVTGCLRALRSIGLLRPALGLANRPTVPGRLAGERAAGLVARSLEDRAAVALAELSGGEQVEHL